MTECPVCAREIGPESDAAETADWVLLGHIGDNMSADYAREALKDYDVPVVVISKSGFFDLRRLPRFICAQSQFYQ